MAWNGSDSAGQPANISPEAKPSLRSKWLQGCKANRPAGRATSMTTPHKAQGVKHGIVAPLLGHRFATRLRLGGYLLIIVALGGAALWFFTRPAPKAAAPKEPKKPSAIKAVKPAPAPTNSIAKVAESPRPSEPPKPRKPQSELRPGDEGFDPAAHPTILIPKKKKEKVVLPYRNATEQALAWIANCQPGDPPLPLLPIPEAEMKNLAAILLDKNEVQKDDSEQTAEQRRIIEYAKSEMREYIKNGGDPNSFLKYYHDQLESMCTEYREAQNSVMELLRSGENDDIAGEYLKKVNARLEAKGIKKIVLSKKKMARHGIVSESEGEVKETTTSQGATKKE